MLLNELQKQTREMQEQKRQYGEAIHELESRHAALEAALPNRWNPQTPGISHERMRPDRV